jgi:transglutaminase superfamily protein
MCEDSGVLTAREGFYDEMPDAGGAPRPLAQTLVAAFDALGPEALAAVVIFMHALRVKPATTRTQRVDDFGVRVDPEARLHQHLDYFGTTVIEFGVSRPHDHLSIDVRARVKTTPPDDPPEAGVFRGTAGAELSASVRMQRTDGTPARA